MTIDIRPWQPGDERAILGLFQAAFQRQMSLDFWRWRFQGHPAGGPLVMLAWSGELLVGHYAASQAPLLIDGTVQKSALSMTTMTHPDFRGQGLLEATGNALYAALAAQGYVSVWGFPNTKINVTRQAKLAWQPIADVATLSLPLDANRADGLGDCQIALAIDARFDRLCARVATAGTLRAQRTAEILSWRIDQNPMNSYIRLVLPEGGDIAGYAILKRYGASAIDLVELCAQSPAAARALIHAAIAKSASLGCATLHTWSLPRDEHRLQLERAGFTAGAPVTYFGGRALLPTKFDQSDSRLWRLSMLDSDLY